MKLERAYTYNRGSVKYVKNGDFRFVGGGKPTRSQSGYGSKITTDYVTTIPFRLANGMVAQKEYRVYNMCYSNSGTLYVIIKGKTYVLENTY